MNKELKLFDTRDSEYRWTSKGFYYGEGEQHIKERLGLWSFYFDKELNIVLYYL